MSDAAATPVAAVQPDPHRAVPERIGQVLGLVRRFIAYGQNLADTVRRHTAEPRVLPCLAFISIAFRTGDLALILARVTRGLLRAAALEARLHRRAARGRDLTPTDIRLPSPPKPRAAKPLAPPADAAQGPALASLPTTQEILTKDRRRPIGAVLVDICLDLGIMPGDMDRATWDELFGAISEYGGSLATLMLRRDPAHRLGRNSETHPPIADGPSASVSPIPDTGQPEIACPAWLAPPPKSPTPACTGPP